MDAGAVTDAGLTLRLEARRADLLHARLSRTSVSVGTPADGAVTVTLAGRDRLSAPASGAHLADSFLIDHSAPSIRALAEEAGDVGEGVAAVQRLSEFVHGLMRTSSYAQGFDVASIVARDRVGDCSEHAVLLTALARAKAMPARTVIGAVVLIGEPASGAFGHAWTEIWADGAWRVADATRPELGHDGGIYYLPLGAVSDEGMGYALGLFDLINAMPSKLYAATDH